MSENPQLNKKIATIFANYLKTKFGWEYKAIGTKKELIPNRYPDVDEILDSDERERLFLQCKRPIKEDDTLVGKEARKNKGIHMFNLLFNSSIKKFEDKYLRQNRDVSNVILLIHSDPNLCYFIQSDEQAVDRNGFARSNFKGIYMVSHEYHWYKKTGKGVKNGVKKEFVSEIKSAFNASN